MTYQITRVPIEEMPTARVSNRWGALMEAVIAAHKDGEAVHVQPMTTTEVNNFSAYLRPKGWRLIRRHVGDGFVIKVEPT